MSRKDGQHVYLTNELLLGLKSRPM